jgi:hypothetical protein
MVKTDANNSKCDAFFYTTAENVRKGMMQSFNTTANVVTGELFNKMTNLKAVVAKYETPIPNANEATKFADEVKVAFNADKSNTTPSSATSSATQSSATQSSVTQSSASSVTSATQSSVTSATPSSASSVTSAPQSSATPSNDVQSVVQSATPSSATPSSATPSSPSNTINAKNANLNNMPVMQQPPEAVANLSELAASAGGADSL